MNLSSTHLKPNQVLKMMGLSSHCQSGQQDFIILRRPAPPATKSDLDRSGLYLKNLPPNYLEPSFQWFYGSEPFGGFYLIFLVILALTAATSVCLGIALLRSFLRPGAAYLLVSVEVASLIRSLWSIFRKPLFGTSQSVASEAVGLFVLFPFQLIIALVISSMLPKQNNNMEGFLVLRIFSVASSILHLTYTLGLIVLAIITVPAFDGDVWMRDIDSNPSPFPLAIIFAFLFPCIAYRVSSLRSLVPQPLTRDPSRNGCLPTCGPNCLDHGSRPNLKVTSHGLGDSTQPRMVCPSEETLKRMPPILPHTLIRIPNAAERRASIYLALPVES